MNIEEVKTFLNENADNEEVSQLLSSISDKRVNQAIETYKKNNEEKKLNELHAQIESLQSENKKAKMRDKAKSLGVPDGLLDYVVGETEEETETKSADLLQHFTEATGRQTEREINNRLAGNPLKGNDGIIEAKSLDKMSSDEILKSWNNL